MEDEYKAIIANYERKLVIIQGNIKNERVKVYDKPDFNYDNNITPFVLCYDIDKDLTLNYTEYINFVSNFILTEGGIITLPPATTPIFNDNTTSSSSSSLLFSNRTTRSFNLNDLNDCSGIANDNNNVLPIAIYCYAHVSYVYTLRSAMCAVTWPG